MVFMVGGNNPSINYPVFIQSSISPIGTVMATQSEFSIQSKSFSFKANLLKLIYEFIS
jgi:hypothetical protein